MQIYFSFRTYSVPVSLIVVLSVFSLVACAPQPEQIRPGEDVESLPVVRESVTTGRINSAVVALIKQADVMINQSRWPDASSLIERAIRIDSYQADSWTRMAIIYLGKENPEQAIQMAKKSNSLAKQNKLLQAWNWSLMSRAYAMMDKPDLAVQAAQTSQRLQQEAQ